MMRRLLVLLLLVSLVSIAGALDLTVQDAARQREIPLRIYLPAGKGAAPVVLFSHGLGGSREGSVFLGEGWAKSGYVAVFLQHPGSDESVWRGAPRREIMRRLKQAASAENLRLRVDDVKSVLTQLERWNRDPKSPLAGRLDLSRVGMSGHSFGAHTTQAVSGQTFPRIGTEWTDPRIKAAIAFSPSAPKRGDAAQAFGQVRIPWLLMTGTKDSGRIASIEVSDRLKVFPALPPGSKYELVLFGAEHSVFTDRPLPGDREARNPKHHEAILRISTAFWDAYLKEDATARAWLDGEGARQALEPRDRWQKK